MGEKAALSGQNGAPGLIGGIAAGRPLLGSCVLVFGLAALTAQGFKTATIAYADASIAYVAALFVTMAAPACAAAIAPGNFWLRLLYAALVAGILLALRRVVLQLGFAFGPFDAGVALAAAAGATFVLAVAAPLWRAAMSFSLIGVLATALAAAGGLSMIAIETGAAGVVSTAGASLGLAAGAGAALSIQIAASFSKSYAEGGDNLSAAADAARGAAAPALFALTIGVFTAILSARAETLSVAGAAAAARVAAIALAASLLLPLFMLAGALALKARTEATAVRENKRRVALRPFLIFLRDLLPPSSALAISAVLAIAAIVAGFQTADPSSAGDYALVAAVALAAAVVFVSLRTALMAALLLLIASRLTVWLSDLAGLAAMTATARAFAAAMAAILYAQLALAWRDRRNPRRKAREVVQMALADSYFAYAASSVLAVAALASSEAAGLWREGVEASLLVAGLALVGMIAAPPLMTAVGALFGRD